METDTQQIIAYFENRLSPDERREMENKLQQSVAFRKEVDDLRFVWETSAQLHMQQQMNTERNWVQLSKRISLEKKTRQIGSFIRSAAAVLLIPVLIATYSLYRTVKNWNNQSIEQIELTSAYGLVSKVTLPDGSEVWLNSGSLLTYPQRFTGDKRVVRLSGEAYFKVKANQSNRFDVLTSNNLQISAYGTEFNVNAYQEEDLIEATLAEGNIEVSLANDPDLLRKIQPGQQASFDKRSNQIDIANVNLSVETAWKDGKMVFRRASMHEVVQRLSRHFNVDIQLAGKTIRDYEYSATFTTESLEEILQLLKKSAPIQYKVIDPKPTHDYSFTKRTILIQTAD